MGLWRPGERFFAGHAQELSSGFELGPATEPVAGVFDFMRVHGSALLILFVYTVIEAR